MKHLFPCVIVLACFLCLSQNIHGQNARILTYEESILIALDKSYTVKSYLENNIAMEQYFNFYKAQFKPRLDAALFTPSWNENVIQVQRPDGLPVYNSFGSMQFGGNVKFTYMLPTGGNFALTTLMYRDALTNTLALQDFQKLKTTQAYTSVALSFSQPIFTRNTLRENLLIAKYQYEQSNSYFTRAQMNIIYDVTAGFYSLYRATRSVEIAGEKLKNSEEAYRIARLKAVAGRIPEGDVLISEVAVAQNKAILSAAGGDLSREEDSFKQLIGLDLEENIQIRTDLKYDIFQVDLLKAIDQAMLNRLELYEAELEVRLQEIELDQAERVREFSGNITAYYDMTGISTIGTGSTVDLFKSSFEDFTERPANRGVTLTFSYPLLDWGRGRARVLQEEANLRSEKLDLDNWRTTIIREVRDVVRSVEEARNRLSIQEKNQEVAQRSYRISTMRFENGDITSQELATEQERLADTQLAYLDAFITYQVSVADLKRKTMWDFINDRSYLKEDYFQKE